MLGIIGSKRPEAETLELVAIRLRNDAMACDNLEPRRRQVLVSQLLEKISDFVDLDQFGDDGVWNLFASILTLMTNLASSYLPTPAEPEYSAAEYEALVGRGRPVVAKRVPVTLTAEQLDGLAGLVSAKLQEIESRDGGLLEFMDDPDWDAWRRLAGELDECLSQVPLPSGFELTVEDPRPAGIEHEKKLPRYGYKLFRSSSILILEQTVEDFLVDNPGWEPLGGVAVAGVKLVNGQAEYVYCQAAVKRPRPRIQYIATSGRSPGKSRLAAEMVEALDKGM